MVVRVLWDNIQGTMEMVMEIIEGFLKTTPAPISNLTEAWVVSMVLDRGLMEEIMAGLTTELLVAILIRLLIIRKGSSWNFWNGNSGKKINHHP